MMRLIIFTLLFFTLGGCANFTDSFSSQEISLEPRTINVAADDIIRIVTPFQEPRVVTVSDAEIERSQNVLYVLFDDQEEISMFVTDSDNETWSINLTLKPTAGGIREINMAPMSKSLIRAAKSPAPVSTPVNPLQKVGPKDLTNLGKEENPWGRPCRLCRGSDDNGSDDYNDSSW